MDNYEETLPLASFSSPQDAIQHLRDYNEERLRKQFATPLDSNKYLTNLNFVLKEINNYDFSQKIKKLKEARVIFIVGLPRSGKSGLEKLLNQFSLFHGAGELDTMFNMFQTLSGPNGQIYNYPTYLSSIPDDTYIKMGHDYIESLQKDTQCHEKIIINTMPSNFIYIPLIQRTLPQARIIWCHRNAKSHCLNLFMKPFKNKVWQFTYSINSLIETYNAYREVYKFYKEKMPEAWIDIEYEDLSKNPKKALSRLFDELDIEISSGAIKKVVRDNQSYLNVIEAENAAIRNYTPYLPELKNIQF